MNNDGAKQPEFAEVNYNLHQFAMGVALAGPEDGRQEPVVMMQLTFVTTDGTLVPVAFPCDPTAAAEMAASITRQLGKIASGGAFRVG